MSNELKIKIEEEREQNTEKPPQREQESNRNISITGSELKLNSVSTKENTKSRRGYYILGFIVGIVLTNFESFLTKGVLESLFLGASAKKNILLFFLKESVIISANILLAVLIVKKKYEKFYRGFFFAAVAIPLLIIAWGLFLFFFMGYIPLYMMGI